jgi:hypothetical protein
VRERIDVRRGDVLATMHAHIPVAEVVGEDDEDLGLPGGRFGGGRERGE